MRFITFDPEADFSSFDDLAMDAMNSVMSDIVRSTKKNRKKRPGDSLLRRALTFAAATAAAARENRDGERNPFWLDSWKDAPV